MIHGGGIPQKNESLNQIYSNVFNRPVLVPSGSITGFGSSLFAFLAAGAFQSIEEAQSKLCRDYRIVCPQPQAAKTYDELFSLYRKLYFALGVRRADAAPLGDVLPTLKRLAIDVNR